MMKFLNISLALTLLFFASCEKSSVGTEECGYLSLVDLTISEQLNTRSSETALGVTIYSSDGSEHSSYESHLELPDKISLFSGDYNIVATNATSTEYAVFDTPIYSGSKDFTVKVGEVSQVSLEASHLSALVEIGFSDRFLSNFNSISVSVTSGSSTLVYSDDEQRIGYFSVSEDQLISYTLSFSNSAGSSYVTTGEIEDIEAKDLINLYFDVEELNDYSEDNAIFKILVDESVNEIVSVESLTPNRASIPTLEAVGFDISSDIDLDYGFEAEFKLLIEAEGGLETLALRFSSDYFTQMSIPAQISILNLSSADRELLSSIGISVGDYQIGDSSAEIDLTDMTALLGVDDSGSMTHTIAVLVIDEQMQSVIKTITLNVSDNTTIASVTTGSCETSSSYDWSTGIGSVATTFNATIGYGLAPDNMAFKYRKSGEAEWILVTDITYLESSKSYSATVNLDLKSTYEYMATSDSGDGDTLQVVTSSPTVPNMSFEDWYMVDATTLTNYTWYPSADEDSQYWVTGNPGVTGIGSKRENVTSPESSHVVSGTAAKLTSISDVTLVEFAAGNLFTGTYSTNMSEPRASVTFGRPFVGRPTRLVGYYDYRSSTIDTHYTTDEISAAIYEQYAGTDDKCHIYILLEKWGDGVTTRPDNPLQIGYGEMMSSITTSSYQKFSIDVEYSSMEVPDHITILATSSYLGDDFVGGSSSVLYVDEFDLEFD